LYALAVEKIFSGDVSVSRLFYSTSRGGFAKVDIDIMPSTREAIGRVLGQIEEAVASGFLPPAPKVQTWGRKHTACDWCDFRPVCGPYEAIRLTRKNPIPELEMLRNEK
jgi:ATP-dependent helicase/nuclease subunit B